MTVYAFSMLRHDFTLLLPLPSVKGWSQQIAEKTYSLGRGDAEP